MQQRRIPRAGALVLAAVLAVLGGVSTASAQALPTPVVASTSPVSTSPVSPTSRELLIHGFSLDASLFGGAGFGIGHAPDNPFLARLRLGGLYAFEPWVINVGVTGELGAIAGVGLGGELEINHFDGWFAAVGLASIQAGHLLGHMSIGYTVVAIEWQHAFGEVVPSDAMMFGVRVPLGFWWLSRQRDKERARRQNAEFFRNNPESGPARPGAATTEPGPSDDDRFRAEKALERASIEKSHGQYARAADEYRRAFGLDGDPLILLALAEVEIAEGRLVLALADLRRFVKLAGSPEALAKKANVEDQANALMHRLGQLRLNVPDAHGDEVAEIDGEPSAAALLGYDVPVDPGRHRVILKRGDRRLAEQVVEVAEGEIARMELKVSASPVTPPADPQAADVPSQPASPAATSEAHHQ